MINRRLMGKGRKHRGQALVEFALAFTIFLLLLLGVLEFGRLLFVYSSVYSAAREAARSGAAVESNPSGTPLYNDCAGIRSSAKRIGALGGIDNDNDIAITYRAPTCGSCPCSGVALGSQITVTVTTPFKFIVLSLPQFPISSSASRTILKDVQVSGQ